MIFSRRNFGSTLRRTVWNRGSTRIWSAWMGTCRALSADKQSWQDCANPSLAATSPEHHEGQQQ